MTHVSLMLVSAALLAVATVGCDSTTPLSAAAGDSRADSDLAHYLGIVGPPTPLSPPAGLVSVQFGPHALEFWPYTGVNFTGTPQDPVNLIFFGHADPREIREALFSLSGDRSAYGLPDMPPFNQTWSDAIGDVQTGYGTEHGWTGGAVHLACGDYAPLRFHIRLFRLGEWTVANAHLDMHIPGTADHQVISWEVAEQFVMIDLLRTGLLDAAAPMMLTQEINQPSFRTIPAVLYNEMPVEMRGLIGGPPGDVSDDVPIGSDGHALVFNLGGALTPSPGAATQAFPITFGQTVPKPFCSDGPYDYVYVAGVVNLSQTSEIGPDGSYLVNFHAEGELQVTPVDPFTGAPAGETLKAVVHEEHYSRLSDFDSEVTGWLFQKLVPSSDDEAGSIFRRLQVHDTGQSWYVDRTTCAADRFIAAAN